MTLREIEKRANAATKGPWAISPPKNSKDWPRLMWDDPNDPREDPREMQHITDLDDGISKEDAQFIAHAREDIPALISAVRELRECLRSFVSDDESAEAVAMRHHMAVELVNKYGE